MESRQNITQQVTRRAVRKPVDHSSHPVLDQRVLDELADGADAEGIEILRRVVASYCNGQLIVDARSAMSAGDWETCERSAHSLKGLSFTIGAQAVAVAAGELEMRACRRDPTSCEDLLARVVAEHGRAHRALKRTEFYDAGKIRDLAAGIPLNRSRD